MKRTKVFQSRQQHIKKLKKEGYIPSLHILISKDQNYFNFDPLYIKIFILTFSVWFIFKLILLSIFINNLIVYNIFFPLQQWIFSTLYNILGLVFLEKVKHEQNLMVRLLMVQIGYSKQKD